MAESFPPPPSYENVMLEDVQKWNLPEEFHQAIQSFIQWPLDPPKNPYRYVNCDIPIYKSSEMPNTRYLTTLYHIDSDWF